MNKTNKIDKKLELQFETWNLALKENNLNFDGILFGTSLYNYYNYKYNLSTVPFEEWYLLPLKQINNQNLKQIYNILFMEQLNNDNVSKILAFLQIEEILIFSNLKIHVPTLESMFILIAVSYDEDLNFNNSKLTTKINKNLMTNLINSFENLFDDEKINQRFDFLKSIN